MSYDCLGIKLNIESHPTGMLFSKEVVFVKRFLRDDLADRVIRFKAF
ncbi:MAG: hypothetical protein ACJAXB_001955 [Candidatus Endobugula sp.]|jgi:hypothetical protein